MTVTRGTRVSPGHRVTTTVAAALAMLLTTALVRGQAPTSSDQTAERLPVRRVVLYKSGVGYFEHLGRVDGDQTVTVDFTSGQLDDVLKSLTVLDLDGGRITGVSFNSEASFERRLGALRLPLGAQATRAQFLSALRGARVELRSGATRTTGRLLSVERITRGNQNGQATVDALSIVSDAGVLQTVALEPGVSVRVLENDLNEEVGRYLSLLASVRDQDLRRLTIGATGAGGRDLFVSYVSEVPVWKATYRLVLPDAGSGRAPLLQGWAIVDNTIGEDWNNVELSLVAGAPQSFVQRVSQPHYLRRPVVSLPDRVQLSPQTHQAGMRVAGLGAVSGRVTDTSGGGVPGAAVRAMRGGTVVASVVTDSNGRYQLQNLAPGVYDLTVALAGFRDVSRSNVQITGGMETIVDATLTAGAMGEGIGVGQGRSGGLASPPRSSINITLDGIAPVEAAARLGNARQAQQTHAAAADLGDLFEYRLTGPITIRKEQSALVPILSGEVEVEKVSLWNAALPGGRPLRAVWLTNSTDLTLDAGSFSVIEGEAFAGEGLIEPLKAGERRLISYATDLAVRVDATGETVPSRVTRVRIANGAIVQRTEERQRRVYAARNEDAELRQLVIEHPAREGWSLDDSVTPAETTAAWHRFNVHVAAKTSVTFTVDEVHPVETQYFISSISDDLVALLVREQAIDQTAEASLREVLTRKADIARLNTAVAARETEMAAIGRDQERVRENMRSLKGSSEERRLLQRYVQQLDEQETRIETLRREREALAAERERAEADLAAFVANLSFG